MRISWSVLLSSLLAAGLASAVPPPRFSDPAAPWNRSIAQAAVHPQSGSMITAWVGAGGFGLGRMQIDFGMRINHAANDAAQRQLVAYSAGPYYLPDCEPLGAMLPVPANAMIEASPGLSCANASNDCHLLVVQGRTLFELYHATARGADIEAQCYARWELDGRYNERLRGEHCTSADAAGLPIAPLLFNADEVFAASQLPSGDLGHAVRFILPNNRMANDPQLGGVGGRLYVRPATHAGAPSGPSASVPYGVRLRLRADFPLTGYNPAAQVILRTLQRYGMILADGGNVALTAESDVFTERSWSELGIGSRVFDSTPGARAVAPADFEVVDTGARIAETFDCVREAVSTTSETLFQNGFEAGPP